MKYHINGTTLENKDTTLIHVETGDDQLEFLTNMLKHAFSIADPLGGPIMWSRHLRQGEMSDSEARGLIGETDKGAYIAHEIYAAEHRYRKMGIEVREFRCDCKSGLPVFALNETLFRVAHGVSSEGLLQKLGARPWMNRIKGARVRGEQQGREHLN